MVGLQPDLDLIALPPNAGSAQVTTGNATATSPLRGTVVDVALPPVAVAEVTPVDEVVPRSDEPQPVSRPNPATITVTAASRRVIPWRGRTWGGVRVITRR